MGKKYIIELEDKPFHKGNGDFLYRVKGFNSLVFDMTGVGKLTPYTEPDLEQVRKEAYEEGAKSSAIVIADDKAHEAFQKGYDAAWEDIQPKIDAAYQKGMSDLWKAMQKAIKMYCEIDNEVFLRVFYDVKCDWGESVLQALFKNTPQHLIDSIRKYEQKQEEQIQVGDEVYVEKLKGKAVVMQAGKIMCCTFQNGDTFTPHMEDCKKTGRHFPEIAEVLRKMREG